MAFKKKKIFTLKCSVLFPTFHTMKKVWIFCFTISSLMSFGQTNLNPCIQNHPFKIVILGSSTAAGAGPSHSDSTWVNKYRKALQSINPQNQVINLAVGGFTTYRVMPNNFITPPNRPAVDTLKNITAALKHQPDAIIINLPSNDRQWPMSEQLSNFDSLYNHSTHNGVPFFVCTTQPIVPLNKASYQRSVRDSIMATYGIYAIDLFLPLADTNNAVLPTYAADAVHLNDSGHAVIFSQVLSANVLGKSFVPRQTQDLAITTVLYSSDKCADAIRSFGWVIANIGDTALPGTIGHVKTTGPISDSTSLILNKVLPPCTTDTLWSSLNMSLSGSYITNAQLTLPTDTFFANNSIELVQHLIAPPTLILNNDTLCKNALTQFQVTNLGADTLFWYSSISDSLPFAKPDTFQLKRDTSLYVQAVNGSLAYQDALLTLENSNINFNGNMFDLLPVKKMTLEKLEVRINGTGATPIKIYTKSGSYNGYENSPADWNLVFYDTIQVPITDTFVSIDIKDTNLLANDTIGFYVHVAHGSNRVMYKSAPQPTVYQNGELTFLSGAGINTNFGTIYPNRILNIKFHYSHGFNRFGQCASPLLEVHKRIDTTSMNLGLDTTVLPQGLTVYTGDQFLHPFWTNTITGDTLSVTDSLWIDPVWFTSQDSISISCIAYTKNGCLVSDTVTYRLSDIGISEYYSTTALVYPNPVNEILNIKLNDAAAQIILYTLEGKEVLHLTSITKLETIDISHLEKGVYLLVIVNDTQQQVYKVLKL